MSTDNAKDMVLEYCKQEKESLIWKCNTCLIPIFLQGIQLFGVYSSKSMHSISWPMENTENHMVVEYTKLVVEYIIFEQLKQIFKFLVKQ